MAALCLEISMVLFSMYLSFFMDCFMISVYFDSQFLKQVFSVSVVISVVNDPRQSLKQVGSSMYELLKIRDLSNSFTSLFIIKF